MHTDAAAGEWTQFDNVEVASGAAHLSVLGADVSSLAKSEDLGGVYRDDAGVPGDALAILKDHGLNWIRLRVFVNPYDGYHGTPELLAMAARAKALGLNEITPGMLWDYAATWTGSSTADDGTSDPPVWRSRPCHRAPR